MAQMILPAVFDQIARAATKQLSDDGLPVTNIVGGQFKDWAGDVAVRFEVVLQDRPDGRLYGLTELRPALDLLPVLAAQHGIDDFVHVLFFLASERGHRAA